jgi:hypothetical protein
MIDDAIYVPMRADTLRPLTAFDNAMTSVELLLEQWPGCAVGVRADRAGLLVIDVDVKEARPGVETIRRLQGELGELPRTRTHRTPSGGWHLLFRDPGGVRGSQNHLRGAGIDAPAVDIVAGRALIRWAPGTPGYRVAREGPIAELPKEWVDALRDPPEQPRSRREVPDEDTRARRYAIAALEREAIELAEIGALRNCSLFKAAASLGSILVLSEDEILNALMIASEQNGALKEHGRRSCEKTIARGVRAGRAKPRTGR